MNTACYSGCFPSEAPQPVAEDSRTAYPTYRLSAYNLFT